MRWCLRVLFILLILTWMSAQEFNSTAYYSIVVVEYQPINPQNLTPQDILEKNAAKYIEILDKLSQDHKIILIAFPEATLDAGRGERELKEFATKIQLNNNPCTKNKRDYPEFIQRLSCAARTYKTMIAFNVIQKFKGEFYNTDVLLDFEGLIAISTKREIRIGEKDLRHNPIPFEIPANRFYRIMGFHPPFIFQLIFTPTSVITGFKFSYEKMISEENYRFYIICSNWISQLPFLTSLQVYQMWAQEFNITLFFSGANNPNMGQGGTGVYYAAVGPIFMDIVAEGGTKAYVYNLTFDEMPNAMPPAVREEDIDPIGKQMDDFKLEVDPDLKRYKSKILNISKPESKSVLCYNKHPNHFCCHFSIKLSIDSSLKSERQYTYHLVAYKGYKTYHSIFTPGGVEICAVIACLDNNITSCGRRFSKYETIGWPLTFERIEIKANFAVPHKERIYYSSQFPNSLLSSIRPIHPNCTVWNKRTVFDRTRNASYLERSFTLVQPQSRILTFAIFGRNFSLKESVGFSSRGNSLLVLSPVLVFVNLCLTSIF